MQLIINNENKKFVSPLSITELIINLGLEDKRIAIEVNEQIIPKGNHNSHQLAEGDKIEIVHAIGGG